MWIPVSKIIVNEQRLNEDKLDDLVEYIERGRKVKPITVRKLPLKYELADGTLADSGAMFYAVIDGHHRLAAYKILGKEMIEVVVTL